MKYMKTAADIIALLHNPTEADRYLIEKAYTFAETAHTPSTRYSGEP